MSNEAQTLLNKLTPAAKAPNAKCLKSFNELDNIFSIADELLEAARTQALVISKPEFTTAYANTLLVEKFKVLVRDFKFSESELKTIRTTSDKSLHAMVEPTIYQLTCIEISQDVLAWIDSFNRIVIPMCAEVSDLIANNLEALTAAYEEHIKGDK